MFISRRAYNAVQARAQDRDTLEQRLARALRACARYRTSLTEQTRRADLLTENLDPEAREAVQRWEARVQAHDAWKPPARPDAHLSRPVDGAPDRPLHPAIELRRALERCQQLEARLAKAEHRPTRGASIL